jgi:outer membrane cobalamin receptor
MFGFCPVSIDAVRTQECEYATKVRAMDGLKLKVQYTNSHARDLTTGKRPARWPVDQASVGLAYQPIEPRGVVVDYRFVGARNNGIANSPVQRLGSFDVLYVAASYDHTKRWRIYCRLDNLFGQY